MCCKWFQIALVLIPTLGVVQATSFGDQDSPKATGEAHAKKCVLSALEAEMAGDSAQRKGMLDDALHAAPYYPPANWLAGRVMKDGIWMSVEGTQQLARDDAELSQYRAFREKAGGDARRQLNLARWCSGRGMDQLAELHYRQILLNPTADLRTLQTVVSKLGLQNVDGSWLTEDEIKLQRETTEQIQRAVKVWYPRLVEWQKAIESDGPAKSATAIGRLQDADDPHLVTVLELFVPNSGPKFGECVVKRLGAFPQQEATAALVRFSVLSPWDNVRTAAITELQQRSLYEFVPMLLAGLVSPVMSQWQVSQDRDGNILYRHMVYQEGQEQNMLLTSDQLHIAGHRILGVRGQDGGRPTGIFRLNGFDSVTALSRTNGDVAVRAEARDEARRRERELAQNNALIAADNSRVMYVLEQTTNAQVAPSPADWWYWWQKYNETVKPKQTQYLYYQSRSSYQAYNSIAQERHSCFVAGTKVWTETGLVPIEQVQIGDRVLSQDPSKGELTFKMVVNKTAGAPTSPLVALTINGEDVLPTLGHVFWVNGKGWRIAKRVEVGDQLHGFRGPFKVEAAVAQSAPFLVFNLVVEDLHTYFVGESGILVHDITVRGPTQAVVPGLVLDKD